MTLKTTCWRRPLIRVFAAMLLASHFSDACAVEPKAKDLQAFKLSVKSYSKKRGFQRLQNLNDTVLMWRREDAQEKSTAKPRATRTAIINKIAKETADQLDAVKKGDLFLLPPLEPKVGAIGKPLGIHFRVVTKRTDTEAVVELPIELDSPAENGAGRARKFINACFRGFDFRRRQESIDLKLNKNWVYVSGSDGAGKERMVVVEPLDIPQQDQEFFDKITTIANPGRP